MLAQHPIADHDEVTDPTTGVEDPRCAAEQLTVTGGAFEESGDRDRVARVFMGEQQFGGRGDLRGCSRAWRRRWRTIP
ncbi:hypothetical protein ACFVW2_36405, partial [Streptomyces sp. NPDC058171]